MGLQIEAVDAADGLDSNGGHSIRHRLHHGQLDPKPSNMAEIRLKPTSRTKNGAAAVVVADSAAGGGVARHCVEMLSNVAAALPKKMKNDSINGTLVPYLTYIFISLIRKIAFIASA